MALCPVMHEQRILEAYRHRFLEFYMDTRVRHVIVFKNHGEDAGASQQHPHSQIVGIPILPGQVVERIERARRFFADSSQCLACTLIAQEREQACRIIAAVPSSKPAVLFTRGTMEIYQSLRRWNPG